MAICLWQISLYGLSKVRSRITSLHHQMKMRLLGKPGNRTSGESSTSALNVINASRYSLPHNATVLGKPFIMEQSIVNTVRNVLANETFKRKPVRLYSVETFPEIVPVTAASSSSNRCGEQHKKNIESFVTNFPGVKLICYDLGFTASLPPNCEVFFEVKKNENLTF